MKPLIGITIGDINGIGPEVALKAATLPSVRALCSPVLIGPMSVFEGTAKHLKLRVKFEKANLVHLSKTAVAVVDVGDALWANVAWGSSTITSGKNAGVAIERAVQLCLEKKLSAFVTAPASKAALSLAGYGFPGQTEMIALLSGTRQVAMMLIAKDFRVGLVTAHTPVREIVQNITSEKIIEKVTIIRHALVRDFAVKNPRLAVLGLNPHAGENGLLGEEEQKFIVPALTTLREQSIEVSGPFPADGFFGNGQHKKYDAVVRSEERRVGKECRL